jgi:hypothetical protein
LEGLAEEEIARVPFTASELRMSTDRPRKRRGRFTEPIPPKRKIVEENGVSIENFYCSQGDHGPPHLHVTGKGDETRIGQNGFPLENDPPLSRDQQEVVEANQRIIRKTLRKIGRWYWFHNVLDVLPADF